MPFWDRCCYPNQGRGGREAFSLLIVKFYCSPERLLANHTTRRRSPRALVPSERREPGLCRGEAKPPALPAPASPAANQTAFPAAQPLGRPRPLVKHEEAQRYCTALQRDPEGDETERLLHIPSKIVLCKPHIVPYRFPCSVRGR